VGRPLDREHHFGIFFLRKGKAMGKEEDVDRLIDDLELHTHELLIDLKKHRDFFMYAAGAVQAIWSIADDQAQDRRESRKKNLKVVPKGVFTTKEPDLADLDMD
jgi:hypothetical protein